MEPTTQTRPTLRAPATRTRHQNGIVRRSIGWTLLVLGAVMFPLPIPFGLVLMVVGVAVLGPDDRHLRAAAARVVRRIRRWSRSRSSWLRSIGRSTRTAFKNARRALRSARSRQPDADPG